MGTILFYIFETTLCLTILYFLFRLFFRKDTLFRTNRFFAVDGNSGMHITPVVANRCSSIYNFAVADNCRKTFID